MLNYHSNCSPTTYQQIVDLRETVVTTAYNLTNYDKVPDSIFM